MSVVCKFMDAKFYSVFSPPNVTLLCTQCFYIGIQNIIIGQCYGVRGSVVFWCSKLCEERQYSNTFTHASQLYNHWWRAIRPCTINLPGTCLFVCYVTKHRGEAAKWQPFRDSFVFYSESAHQKPALVVSGPREDANPSVNDKLRS